MRSRNVPPFQSVIGVGLLTLLATLCGRPAADEQTVQKGHVFVQGRHFDVPLPAGTIIMAWRDDFDRTLGVLFPDAHTIHALFISEGKKGSDGSIDPASITDMAVVTSDSKKSLAQARAEIARQRLTTDVPRPGAGSPRKVSELLRRDPEGREDVPIALPDGFVAELGTFAIDACAFGVVEAVGTPGHMRSQGIAQTFLRGRTVVVLRDRVLELQMRRDVSASTRTGPVFRDDFRSWSRQVVDQNRDRDAVDTHELDRSGPLPKFGEFVYVEQLPTVVGRVPPPYPIRSQQESASGKVIVQALVGRDGRVHDAKVTDSSVGSVSPQATAELEAAALWAVRQWRFHPATAALKPVAVWVEIPVKFSLQ